MKEKRILIITRTTFFDIDKIGAALVLAKILGAKNEIETDIYMHGSSTKLEKLSFLDKAEVHALPTLKSSDMKITLDSKNIDLGKLEWEEKDGKIEIKLVPRDKSSDFQVEPKVEQGVNNYSLVVALGIKTEKELRKILGDSYSIWETAKKKLNIDLREENGGYADKDFIYPQANSYAETVINFAQQRQLQLTKEIATELLTLIYWKTNSLRNSYTSPEILTTVAKLIEGGAELERTNNSIYANSNLIEIKARQEAYQNLKILGEGIAISQVSKDTAHQLAKQGSINPQKNPLSIVGGVKASFTLVPIERDQTLVLATVNDTEINVRKWFGQYNYVGSKLQSEFSVQKNISDTEQLILETIRHKLSLIEEEEKKEQQVEVNEIDVEPIDEQPQLPEKPKHKTKKINQEKFATADLEVEDEYDPLVPAKSFELLEPETSMGFEQWGQMEETDEPKNFPVSENDDDDDGEEVSEEELLEMMGPFMV